MMKTLPDNAIAALVALRECVLRAKGGFAVDDHKALQALMLTNGVLHEAGVKLPHSDPFDNAPILPFPVATIVRFKAKKGQEAGKGMYLIEKMNEGEVNIDGHNVYAEYAILGHGELGTKYEGSAWHDHDELELMKYPDADTFRMYNDAINDGEGSGDDDDED